MMDNVQLSTISELTGSQKFALKKGGLVNVEDLLLMHPQDVKKKCRIEHSVYQSIMDTVCKTLNRAPRPLAEIAQEGRDMFTTGDSLLDQTLGGGLRTRMIWELVGEGASGKTQLALQLSLTVQLPRSQGGLHGRACYLRTYSSFPTPRLLEILNQHPLLASSPSCDLVNILTIETKSVEMLQFVLSTKLPELLQQGSSSSSPSPSTSTASNMPVRLLVIDSLAELFSDSGQSSTLTLAERSRNLSEISVMLHRLASEHQLAIVVVNNVVDVFDTARDADAGQQGELLYNDQARFFNRADSLSGEDRKSAALGLVWANQINARIMLTRTGRRRYVDESERVAVKRARPVGRLRPPNSSSSVSGRSSTPQQQTTVSQDQTTLIRRLNVIFSSVCEPGWVDFVITSQGVETLKGSNGRPVAQLPSSSRIQLATVARNASHQPSSSAPLVAPGSSGPRMADVAMLDVAMAEQDLRIASPEPEQTFDDQPQVEDEDEEDAYWKEVDDIGGLDEAAFEMLDEGGTQGPASSAVATG